MSTIAKVVVRDGTSGAIVMQYNGANAGERSLTVAEAAQLVTDVNNAGAYPADGGRYPLTITVPGGRHTSQQPLAAGLTVAAIALD